MPQLVLPTLLVQCTSDTAVPAKVGEYLQAHLPKLRATGHCPYLSAPLEVLAFLQPPAQLPGGTTTGKRPAQRSQY